MNIEWDDFIKDKMLILAIAKALEIIGEAASKISDECRRDLPEFPWHAMIGMRNHLVHGYFNIDMSILWITSTQELPALISKLEPILNDNSPYSKRIW